MDPSRTVKTHCTFFLRFGQCDYWPCKYSHEQPSEGTEDRKTFDWTAKNSGVVLVDSDSDADSNSVYGRFTRKGKKVEQHRPELRAKVVGGNFESRISELGINRGRVPYHKEADYENSSDDDDDEQGKEVKVVEGQKEEADSEASDKEEDELISF